MVFRRVKQLNGIKVKRNLYMENPLPSPSVPLLFVGKIEDDSYYVNSDFLSLTHPPTIIKDYKELHGLDTSVFNEAHRDMKNRILEELNLLNKQYPSTSNKLFPKSLPQWLQNDMFNKILEVMDKHKTDPIKSLVRHSYDREDL
jgi:hypothetical protein